MKITRLLSSPKANYEVSMDKGKNEEHIHTMQLVFFRQ
jgi:hypothetical protein